MKMTVQAIGFESLIDKLSKPIDISETLYRIGAEIARFVEDTFRRESDPWGNPWQELAKITRKKRAANKDGKILQATGNLLDSLNVLDEDVNHVWVGFQANYAMVPHQLGEDPNPWGKTTPARPIMPIHSNGVDLPNALQATINKILMEVQIG